MIRTQQRPEIGPEEAAEAVREHFGLEGRWAPLPGERDRNFLLEGQDGHRWVVKVTSPEEPDEHLQFETRLLTWLAREGGLPVPGLVAAASGERIVRHAGPSGSWRIRVLEHLPGRVFAEVRPHGPELLEDLGRNTAELALRLGTFTDRPPLRPNFIWALAQAGRVMQASLDLHDGEHRALLSGCLDGFRSVEQTLVGLPTQVIHGDINDHNVLVGEAGTVTGLLDFGDAHDAPAVFDLAIALAYAVLGQRDPFQAAARMAAGYHAVRPLSDEELTVLFPLIRARLAASVSIAASRRRNTAEVDPYLLVSEEPAWTFLGRTAGTHPHLARGFLREACGLPACPRSPALVTWLRGQSPAPVMDIPADGGTVVLDLSVASPLLTGRDTDDTPAFTRRVWDAMDEAGATVGVGRYREPRGFYLTDAFAGRPAEMPERRTVHMGIDVFAEPGAEVRAPLAGVVRSVADNAQRLDYGPTVILEHETPHGPVWTLYGHLERDSVAELKADQTVAAGEVIARIGPCPENGDWPPHLHFQIMTDRLGYRGDFPGVAAPREVEVWASFLPDPNLLLGIPLAATWTEPKGLADRRARMLGPSLSLSYREPIHVVRGRGAHLYDAWGREYLDCVNNVPHVGHEHPRVVAAGQRQMAVLNTNTRYLHGAVLRYAERLSALLPDPLEVCYFVNSGSEANELALRMARTVTGGRGVVALEGGYHGNTQGLVDVSHYKFARAGGSGPPPWVRAALMPDVYRGSYRRDDPEASARYADQVRHGFRDLADAGHGPAAFLAESILSCGGQIEPPAGYFQQAFTHARAAGALCIADEVQVGFGRVGSHMWGFEIHGVVPDIVTLGKPMGNGHPMGAVVTSRAIAEAFANGMEFFSTFGGNPVSAEIGLAVLDVLADEGLPARAHDVGNRFRAGLAELMERHGAVGDVRGRGLFLGVELVSDRATPTPSRPIARYAVGRMKEKGILLSTDGPDDNVIKIKPPLCFSAHDADRVVAALDEVLGEDRARP
ncbi:MAG TPA: aminotransferase class III-fold pyridoxal phosphate-dependent enzyme [Longimicrobiales bacterium]|nr:aminotransferase class III-fold pyridoxal phosphate-dependent enzyme [Longimicrobiales bacterium]